MVVHRRGVIVVVFALAVTPVVFGLGPTSPLREAQPTRLDSCTTITESGRYVLSGDIESPAKTCIRVNADDVVLSGAGHSVDGGVFRENTTGVAVTGANVTVRNLSVRRWTFGIRYESAPDGVVRNVRTWRTVDGVTFASSPGASVTRLSAMNGVSGISFVDSDEGIVRDSTIRYQSSTGVFVADSRRVAVANATVTRTETGIALLGSRQGRVNDSVVRATGTSSLLLLDSRGNSVRNVTLSNPRRPATVLLSNATDNRIVGTDGNWSLQRGNDGRKNSVMNSTSDSSDYPLSA
ncbi:NosD domain-containing protein [Haladaptatus sp. DFWS20]|uniref:NosD domain-containing protein n=1 Tax=Haladaptatus sp. DFWS20 TaxID=3403467 RepID=UPI003EBEA36D